MAVPIVPVRIGDTVRLKKGHPCGANEWEITKLGMDIGLLCRGCGRKVRLERYDFDRRFRGFVTREGSAAGPDAGGTGAPGADAGARQSAHPASPDDAHEAEP